MKLVMYKISYLDTPELQDCNTKYKYILCSDWKTAYFIRDSMNIIGNYCSVCLIKEKHLVTVEE
jgi:hypothetical protein